jgi:hypothetical protein
MTSRYQTAAPNALISLQFKATAAFSLFARNKKIGPRGPIIVPRNPTLSPDVFDLQTLINP